MVKKCQECAGTGFIEQVEQDTQNAQNVDAGLDVAKTKRKSHWGKKE